MGRVKPHVGAGRDAAEPRRTAPPPSCAPGPGFFTRRLASDALRCHDARPMPLVFVYGPDSLQGRMYDRIGPSSCLGPATLLEHALVFNKPNLKRRAEGLPNIQPEAGAQVFGLLFDLKPQQYDQLDGFFGGYERVSVRIYAGDPRDNVTRKVQTWQARRTKRGLLPSYAVKSSCVAGMTENGAPDPLIEAVRALEVCDPENIMVEIIVQFTPAHPEEEARAQVTGLGGAVRRRMRGDHEDQVTLLCRFPAGQLIAAVAVLEAMDTVELVERNDADYQAS